MPTVEQRGVCIHFEESGRGTPIVLGHSFLCSGDMWAPQVPALTSVARVVNLDLRGHGRSSPVAEPFTLYDLIDDVVAVMDHLEIASAVWCGLSIGGMVALRAALRVPERVCALILANTHAGAETTWNRMQYGAMGAAARILGMGPLVPSITRKFFGQTTRRERPDLVREWAQFLRALDVPSNLAALHALRNRDSIVARLGAIEQPALVITGDEDVSLPPPYSEEIAAALPHARLVRVPKCGHLSTLEQPDIVTDAILEFLKELPATT